MIFSKEALLNYFSELLGIIITLILVPLVVNIYNKRKNRTKVYLGKRLLLKELNKQLDKLVPADFKDYDKGYFVDSGIIDFELKSDVDIESFFNLKFTKERNLKKTKQIADDYLSLMNEIRDSLFDVLRTYEDIFQQKLIKCFYQLDFNIKTQERLRDRDDIDTLSETIRIVIELLNSMIIIVIEKEEKTYFEDLKKAISDNNKNKNGL